MPIKKTQPKIYGIRDMSVHHGAGIATEITIELIASPGYNAHHLYEEKGWSDIFPGDVIVKCGHCNQYGARKTACKHCGASID